MKTILITYNPKDIMARGLMDVLSMIDGVEIDDDVMLTEKEKKLVAKAEKSKIHTDISKLKQYIESKL